MEGKCCFFIGHREASEEIYPALCSAVREHIVRWGVTEYIIGHYGGFDRLAAKAIKTAKQCHPELKLTLLLPYHPAKYSIFKPDGFDYTFYPPGMETVPGRAAIVRANRYMVDHADFLIAYVCHAASNAENLLTYAKKRERKGLIRITNLGENSFIK